jgi:hypothetical protein
MMKTILRSALLWATLLLAFTSGAALQWSNVGMAGFSGTGTFQPKMTMGAGSTPYVVYNDEALGDKITVKKFDGSAWVLVGNAGFSTGAVGNPEIKINATGEIYVIYSDYDLGGKATVQKFDGTAWVLVGAPGFSSDATEDKDLDFDSSGNPYVAYKETDYNNENIDVMRFNGTAWVMVGSTNFSCNNTSRVSLALDAAGNTYVAYIARGANAYTHRLTVQRYNGTAWTILGAGSLATGGTYSPTLAFNSQGELYMAFTEGFPNYLVNVKKYDGTAWVSVGTANFSAGDAFHLTMAIDQADVPYVAYEDASIDYELQVKKLTGSSWSTVGTVGKYDIMGAFPCIAFDAGNTPYISVQEDYDRHMIVKRFTTVPDYATGTITGSPFCPGATVSIPFTITNGSFDSNNEFKAELSDANGAFGTNTFIGTLNGNTPGTITATLPFNADGTGYRIRIVSSSPNAVSDDNGTDLTVRGIHNGVKLYTGGNGDWEEPGSWSPCGVPDAGDDVSIDGAVVVTVPEYYYASAKGIVLSNGAKLQLREGANIRMQNSVLQINAGTELTLDQSSSLIITDNSSLIVNGILDNNAYIENSGTISGSGTINQNGFISNRSTAHIAPGNSPGKLTVNGDLDLGEATLDIEVNGSTPGTQYDVLEVNGDVRADDASLQVTQDPGFTLTNIVSITFLRATNISGTMANNLPPNTVINYNNPAIGQVSLSGLASPLPVKLIDFKGTAVTQGNLLSWTTAEETGTNHFELERSADARQFTAISQTEARGKANNYSWTDVSPLPAINYYRLKMVESNGEATYSNTVVISNNATPNQSVLVTPNPAHSFIVVTNTNASLEGSTAIIYDMQGRQHYRFIIAEKQTIHVGNWPAGGYMLKLETGELIKIIR